MTVKRNADGLLWLGVVLLVVGILLLLKNFGILIWDFIFENIWAWAFIAVGAFMVYKALVITPYFHKSPGLADFSDGFVEGQNMAGDLAVILDKPNFHGGRLRTAFGRLTVDATKLSLPAGSHQLHLEVTFGEIIVKLPSHPPVRVVASNVAGDIRIYDRKWDGLKRHAVWQSDHYDAAEAKLEIICSLVFGDINVA